MTSALNQNRYYVAIAATAGAVAGFAAAKLWSSQSMTVGLNKNGPVLPTTNPESENDENVDVYDTQKYVNEYLLLHYGEADEVLRHSFVPMDSLEFPRRVAKECLDAYNSVDKSKLPNRAFDVGCGMGRTTFELAREFEECIGLDFSQAFVDGCNKLKESGEMEYEVCEEGDVNSKFTAKIDANIDRTRTRFIKGDACNLPADIGQFGCVVAANLLCRLPHPYKLLEKLPELLPSGGVLVITTPCSWSTQYTPKANWLGGFYARHGKNPITTFDTLKRHLGRDFTLVEEKNMRVFIRETARKNQWIITQATIWHRK